MARSEFRTHSYPKSSVFVVYADRAQIWTDPPYQRISGIWTLEKRQLLIDSILNDFDIPKMYLHEIVELKEVDGREYRYALVDGKQRLQAIWDFMDGKFPLDERFNYLHDDDVKAAGMDYSTLAANYPRLKNRFDASPLDIVTIVTDDIELIEDMFSRLNEAMPLNAPEKRNAFGGPLPPVIREVAGHKLFTTRLPFKDKRYRHRDLTCKFLYLAHRAAIVNTKKSDLDRFVGNFKTWRQAKETRGNAAAVKKVAAAAKSVLDLMVKTFKERDPLLRQVGMTTLLFQLFRLVLAGKVEPVRREMLWGFEQRREANRLLAEEESDDVELDLIEFDKHSQTPNDMYAIKIRLRILLKYLKKEFKVKSSASSALKD